MEEKDAYVDRSQEPITENGLKLIRLVKDKLFLSKNRASGRVTADNDDESDRDRPEISPLLVDLPFPVLLYRLVNDAVVNGWDHLVSWREHGRAFVILNRNEFARVVMTRYVSPRHNAIFVEIK